MAKKPDSIDFVVVLEQPVDQVLDIALVLDRIEHPRELIPC